MSWEWNILIGVVRILFLFAPFLSVREEFAIPSNIFPEAREFARASNCRALLVSFPAEFFLRILAEASTRCQRPNLLVVAVYFVVGSVLAFGFYKIRATPYFRGTIRPFIWLISFTILGIAFQVKGLALAVGLICRE